MGEWTESSEDDSSAESEAPRKKMKLSVRKEKDKENRWQFVFCFVFYLLMKRKSRHLGRSSYPRTPLLALNGPCQTSFLGTTAEMLDFAMNPTSKSR